MKIVADTNVLLRFVLGDDSEQYALALDAMEQAEAVVVTNHALCEMAWVLRSRYGVTRENIVATISLLRETKNVVIDSTAVDYGLSVLAAGADFADGVIAYEGQRLGGNTFVSFDRKAITAINIQGQPAKLLA